MPDIHPVLWWCIGVFAYILLGLIVVALVLPKPSADSGMMGAIGRGHLLRLLIPVWPIVLVVCVARYLLARG